MRCAKAAIKKSLHIKYDLVMDKCISMLTFPCGLNFPGLRGIIGGGGSSSSSETTISVSSVVSSKSSAGLPLACTCTSCDPCLFLLLRELDTTLVDTKACPDVTPLLSFLGLSRNLGLWTSSIMSSPSSPTAESQIPDHSKFSKYSQLIQQFPSISLTFCSFTSALITSQNPCLNTSNRASDISGGSFT